MNADVRAVKSFCYVSCEYSNYQSGAFAKCSGFLTLRRNMILFSVVVKRVRGRIYDASRHIYVINSITTK